MKQIFEIDINNIGKRLDNLLVFFTNRSRSVIQKLIREGHVSINKIIVNKSSFIIKEGIIELNLVEPKVTELAAKNIPLEIIYEDKDIAIINKQAGISVHSSSSSSEDTLINALLYNIANLSNVGDSKRPGIVHRLDKETSGVLIIAKSNEAHNVLSEDFKNRKIEKKYLAITKGVFNIKRAEIKTLIGRDKNNRKKMSTKVEEGREAHSYYDVLEEVEKYSLVEIKIKTGRTHQIRVHLSLLDHPILGDGVYGKKGHYSRQMLHAHYISFNHPISKDLLRFYAPLPIDFLNTLDELSFTYHKE